MKSQMSYKAKRKVITIAIIILLAIFVSIGTLLYIKGNNQTEAMSEMNGTSNDKAGEDYQIEQAQIENDNNNNSNDEEEVQEENNQQNDNSEINNEEDNTNNAQTTTNSNNQVNNQTQTQTITTAETVETTNTVVGFEPTNVNLSVSELNVKLPNVESRVEAITETTDNYVVHKGEILYNIIIKNNGDEELKQINVSTMIPEGTELIEDSISDNGIMSNGTISWKVDVDKEKTVSFTVKVSKESGEIIASAIVNGKETNTVTNVVDEAPVLTVVDSNKYQMEIGTEYQEKGYSAIDKEDGDITDKVVLSYRFQAMGEPTWENPDPTELDTTKLGVYKITYTVTDSRGNIAKGTRVVEIVDTQDPKLNIENLNEAGFVNTKGDRHVNVDDASPFTTEVFDKDGKLLSTREGYQLENGTYHDRFNIKRFGEGTFTIKVTDKAGNETNKTFTVDTIEPEINIKDGSYINTNISPRIKEANLESATISKDDGEAQEYPITDGIGREISKEGKYTITLTDKAGNVTVVSFIIDKTAPSMKVGEKVYGPNTTEIIYSNVQFKADAIDELSGMEQIYTNGHKRDRIDVNGEGKYTFRLVDKAGNESIFTVIVDKTAPVRKSADFYVTGKKAFTKEDDGKEYQFFYAKNGDKLVLNAKFKEELAQVPTFTLIDSNNTEYVLTAEYVGLDDKGGYTYQTSYNIAEDELNLAEGELTFRISNIIDKAGNVGEDITKPSNSNRIIYDRTAPEYNAMGIFNWTNNKNGENVSYANKDEHIRLFVSFPEMLEVNPKVDIYGENGIITTMELTYGEKAKFYYVEFDTTDELKLPQGKIQFRIYGYADTAGNVGRELTQNDTTDTRYPEVIYDTIAPEFEGLTNGIYYQDDITVNVKDENLESITAKVYANNYEIVEIQNGDVLSQESIYYLTATDKAGNSTSIYVAVDKTNPVFTTLQNGYQYDKEVTIEVEDLKLKTIEVFYYEDRTTKVVENGTKLTEDGTYKIIATDYSGRSTQIYIEIDTKAPEIKGLDNGEYVNRHELVTITDKNLKTVTINGVEQKHDGKRFEDKLTHDGKFVIVAIDKAGNKTEKTVTIDTTEPEFEGLKNGIYYQDDITVNVKEENLESITATVYANNYEVVEIQNGDVLSQESIYYLTATDKAGNSTSIYVAVDKTNPVFTTLQNGHQYDKEVTIEVEDLKLKTIEVFYYEDKTTRFVENGTKLTEDGTYKIIATDYSGRSTQIYIEIDTKAPEIKGLDDGEYVNKNEKITITDKNLATVTINGVEQEHDGKRFEDKLTHEGTFVIVAIDRAGNKTEKTVTIDKTAPTPTFSYSNYSEGDYLPTNKDVEVTLKSNEPIKDIEGWNKVDDKTFIKEYSKNGEYKVTVEDLAGNTSIATFTVKGIDKEAPELKLNGKTPITIEAGEEYKDEGAIAIDNVDGTVNAKIVKINYSVGDVFKGKVDKIDITKPGLYKIVYQYTDKAGNVGTDGRGHDYLIREVIVEDTTAPVLTLNGDSSVTIAYGEDYQDEGATATDIVDGTVEAKIDLIHYYEDAEGKNLIGKLDKIDPTKPGLYRIVYVYTDKAGNVGLDSKGQNFLIRNVIVEEQGA